MIRVLKSVSNATTRECFKHYQQQLLVGFLLGGLAQALPLVIVIVVVGIAINNSNRNQELKLVIVIVSMHYH